MSNKDKNECLKLKKNNFIGHMKYRIFRNISSINIVNSNYIRWGGISLLLQEYFRKSHANELWCEFENIRYLGQIFQLLLMHGTIRFSDTIRDSRLITRILIFCARRAHDKWFLRTRAAFVCQFVRYIFRTTRKLSE